MVQLLYTDEKLFDIAKESYQNMRMFCETLDIEGYWKEPEEYLHQTIYNMLDMYLQAVLLNLSIYCGRCRTEEKRFIINLPSENVLHCVDEGDLPEETLLLANRLLKNPPILLQLCGVRDAEKNSFFSSYFMDSLFNILISISMLSKKQSPYANKFISEYYEKITYFLNEDQKKYIINNRYIFLKLSQEKFQKMKVSVRKLKEENMKAAKEKEEIERKKAQLEAQKNQEEAKLEREKAERDEMLRLAREEMIEIMRSEEEEKKTEELDEQNKQKRLEDESKDILKEMEGEAYQRNNREILEGKDKNNEQKEQIKKKEKSIFEYTDEELMELQRMGKLKIQAPKLLEYAKKERFVKKIEEQKVDDIRKEIDKINQAKRLQELLEELSSLIGLEEVKVEINSLINLIKVRKMRESYCMPTMDITYHMVFTGNPGTGKTTVARLVAQIYKELGILSKGHLVEVDRSGLVAGYVGQTAMKVKEVIEKAMGGVLFIDEAYSLANKNDTNDFGSEAIDTLVKMMEDNRDNLVVIVAGYKNEMDSFLKANTGLISRFNKFVDFKDYTNEQLMDILQMLADKSGVELEEEAKGIIFHILKEMTPEKKQLFGNGRGMRNTFENIMVKQANRIVLMDMPTEEELKMIRREDVIDIL